MNEQILKTIAPWVGGIGALIAATMSIVSFGYDTFASKETVQQQLAAIEKRLDRIEQKIDTIRERH
jgi:hypothetical protein